MDDARGVTSGPDAVDDGEVGARDEPSARVTVLVEPGHLHRPLADRGDDGARRQARPVGEVWRWSAVTRGEAHAQPDADAEALELLLGPSGEAGLVVAQLGEDRVAGVHELDADAGAAEVGDGGRHLDTGHAATGDEHRVPAQSAACGGRRARGR